MRRSALVVSSITMAAALALVTTSCRRPAPPPPVPAPRAVIAALVAARAQHDYAAIGRLTRPDAASLVTQTLIAIDDFSDANRELCAYIRSHLDDRFAALIDQSGLVGDLEVFSAAVELLDEQIDGDSAVVSFTVNNRLPAQRARLARIGGQWRYDPGPLPSRDLPAAFRRMAEGLRAARTALERGRPSADEIRRDPDALTRLVMSHLAPGVERLPPPPTSSPNAER